MYKVYILEFPNGKKYCGQTKRTLKQRAGTDGIFYKSCPKVWNAIKKYGWDNVKKQVIAEFETQEECDACEQKTILDLKLQDDRYGYNISAGGQGVDSSVVSNSLKQRFSNSKEREKISHSMKSYCQTEDGRQHIKDLAKQNSIAFGYGVVQFNLSDGKPIAYYHSYSEAVFQLSGKRHGTCVQRVVNGERLSYKGFGWRRPTQEDKEVLGLD